MIVITEDHFISSYIEPVILLLSPNDIKNISNIKGMHICIFPSHLDEEEVNSWMLGEIERRLKDGSTIE
jgi:energy-converting hydrogenase Eha subunit B